MVGTDSPFWVPGEGQLNARRRREDGGADPYGSLPLGTGTLLQLTAELIGTTVYVGGNFLNLHGHTGLAAFPVGTGTLTPSRPTSTQATKSPPWRPHPMAPAAPTAASPTSPVLARK